MREPEGKKGVTHTHTKKKHVYRIHKHIYIYTCVTPWMPAHTYEWGRNSGATWDKWETNRAVSPTMALRLKFAVERAEMKRMSSFRNSTPQ